MPGSIACWNCCGRAPSGSRISWISRAPSSSIRLSIEPEAVEKHLTVPGLAAHVAALAEALRTVDPFDEPHVEAAVRGSAAERGIKAGC